MEKDYNALLIMKNVRIPVDGKELLWYGLYSETLNFGTDIEYIQSFVRMKKEDFDKIIDELAFLYGERDERRQY